MERNSAELVYKTKHNGTVALLDLDADMPIEDFHDACARLALAAGYHPDSVNEAFNTDED